MVSAGWSGWRNKSGSSAAASSTSSESATRWSTTAPDAQLDRNGDDHQRAFIWRGRNAEPVRVGPRGFDSDTAYELTDTGLINGVSENSDGGSAAWVQDLATGDLTFFDIDSGPRGADHGYANIRRINGTGAAAGVVDRSADDPFAGSDAVAFEGPDAPMTLLPESQEALAAGAVGHQ